MNTKKITARKSKYGPQGLTGRLAALEETGELTITRITQSLKIQKKQAQQALWGYRAKQKKAAEAAEHGPGIIKAGSAVARLMAPPPPDVRTMEAEGDRLFAAVVQLIGCARAEVLLKAERARIVAALRGVA